VSVHASHLVLWLIKAAAICFDAALLSGKIPMHCAFKSLRYVRNLVRTSSTILKMRLLAMIWVSRSVVLRGM
jgi:hypothetical protein